MAWNMRMMKRPLLIDGRCLAVMWCLTSLLASGSLQAQLFNGGGLFNRKTEAPRAQTEDEIGVPVPVTGRVEVMKGHEVTFEIRAESKTPGATVEFLIRTFPAAGKIVSLVSKPNERNKAIVTYWADPSSSATSDVFSFAVRYRGGRYSSAVRYDIDIVDLKTEIQAPAELDFGEVMIGGEAVRELTVRNLGNGQMERQIFLSPPWHLVDPADGKLSLGPRGARVLKVAFRPELMGETSYFLSFSRSKSGTTKLLGVGADPFQVVAEAVELVLDEQSGERRGEIQLSATGSQPLLVKARASTRLQEHMLEGYRLAPGEVTRIPVKLGTQDTAPFDGTVEFALDNGYAKSVRVVAAVVPARLEVEVSGSISSEIINFGKVEAGRSLERSIKVTNRGGVGVPLEFHVPEPFRLLTNPGPMLAPLSAVELSIGLFPPAASRGSLDVTMRVTGQERSIPIRLLANVIAPEGAPSNAGRSAALNLPPKGFRLGGGTQASVGRDAESSDGEGAALAPAVPQGSSVGSKATSAWDESSWESQDPIAALEVKSLVSRDIDMALRRPEDITVLGADDDSLLLGWTAPRYSGKASYELEVRGMFVDLEKGLPENVWTPYRAVEIEQIDRLVKAKVSQLRPMTQYEFRVVMVTEEGRSSPPSESIVAQTQLPMDWTYIYLTLGLLLLAGLGWGARRIYLSRRPEVYQSQYADV